MTLKKELKDKLIKKANGILARIDDLEYLPTDLPESCEAIIVTSGELRIGMPLDPPLNKVVRQQFIDAGFEVDDYELDEWGMFPEATAELKLEDRRITFSLSCFAHSEGATCTIESIGEVTETKIAYEVVCIEGAEEKAFA